MNKIKTRVYNTIRDDDENDIISNIFDCGIIVLIVINVILVIVDTFNISNNVRAIFDVIEIVSVIIFTIEYLLRLWTANYLYPDMSPIKARFKYMFTFMALIDLFAILPFFIPFIIPVDLRVLRTLRIVRLLRLFKVNRYTNALSTIGDVFKKKASQLLSAMLVVLLLMIITSVLMYNVENAAQPEKFENAFASMWWAIATLTTVGYGDIYPVTIIGKILSAVIALLGVGLVAVPTGIISAGFMEHINKNKKDDVKHFCPYCGQNLDE